MILTFHTMGSLKLYLY